MSICKHQFKSGRCVHCGSLAVGIINALKQQLKGSEARCKSRDKVIYSLEQQLVALERRSNHAIGWMYAEACSSLDRGEDIRKINFPDIIARMDSEIEEQGK